MEIVEVKASTTAKDPSVIHSAVQASVRLSDGVRYVKSGTPLRPGPGGWVPALDGYGELVAGNGGYGGDTIDCWRTAVLRIHHQKLKPGRVRVSDVNDYGLVTFTEAPDGLFIALTENTVLMDMSVTGAQNLAAMILAGMPKKEA